LGQGRIDGAGYIVCPWHYWKFHCQTGVGEPGYEADRVPRYALREVNGRLYLNPEPETKRAKVKHDPHPLERPVEHVEGPIRVLGISTTAMDPKEPRYSTSEALLEAGLDHARAQGAETRLLKLSELSFRACEGFYSKSAQACTWPCSITQLDPADHMDQVYEGLVHWADVVLLATPIRWGGASALYYKMVERLNCVQNAITIRNKVLIQDKVAAFIITGGQDNVQAVAGQLLGFFAELGFLFPPFPYVAHSRGWSAEDMERNVAVVAGSEELREGTRELVSRSLVLAERLIETRMCEAKIARGGRKAHRLEAEPVE
jgi:multimeric flavodoxin WrbA